MSRIEYEPWEIDMFNETEEGKKYLEYNDKVGGEPLGLIVPFGYPDGFERYGTVIVVYDECIKRGITWEELLEYHPPDDVII